MDGIRGHAICSKGKPALVKSSSFPTAATRSDPFADHEMTVMAKKTPKGQLDITGSLRRNPPPQPKKPPKAGAFRRRPNSAQSTFRTFYDQGHIPIMQCDTVGGCKMKWAESVPDCALLDYHHYLPLFFDGLRETTHPYEMMAEEGVRELLEHGHGKVLSVVPQLILPIKNALETHDKRVVCRTLLAIQRLCVSADMVGEALVPYYRQILPVLNKFKNKNCNLGDQIDYGQQKKDNIGDLIEETLCILEKHGGQDAYINIKYMIPTYESCIQN